MSDWLGKGLSQLSQAAEQAAAAAAAAKAEAEAKLKETLENAESSGPKPSATQEPSPAKAVEVSEADFSALSRDELTKLLVQRSQKLAQAVTKYRTLHGEYKRVQRDYEALQEIVRGDAKAKSEAPEPEAPAPLSQMRKELKDAKEMTVRLEQQLLSRNSKIEELEEALSQAKGSLSAQSVAKKDESQAAEGQATEGLQDLQQKIKEMEEKLDEKDLQVSKVTNKAKTAIQDLKAKLTNERQEAEAKTQELQAKAEEEHQKVLELRKEMEELQASNPAPPQSAATSGPESSALIADLENLRLQNQELTAKLVVLSKTQKERDEASRERDKLYKELEALKTEMESAAAEKQQEVKKIRTEARKVVEAAKQKADQAEEKRETLQSQISQLQGEIATLKTQLQQAESTPSPEESNPQVATLEQKLTDLDLRFSELQREKIEAVSNLEAATAAMQETVARLETSEAEKQQMMAKLEAAETERQQAVDKVDKVKADAKKVVEAAKGRFKESEAKALALEKELEGLKASRESSNPQSPPDTEPNEEQAREIQELKEQIEELSEALDEARAESSSFKAETERLRDEVSSLKGEAAALGAQMTELQQSQPERASVSGAEDQVANELRAQIQSLNAQVEELKEQEQKATEVRTRDAEQLQQLRDECSRLRVEAEAVSAEGQKKAEADPGNDAAAQVEELRAELERRSAEAEELRAEAQQCRSEAKEQQAAASAEVNAKNEDLKAENLRANELEAKAEELRATINTLRADANNLKSQGETLKSEAEQLRSELKQAEKKAESHRSEADVLKVELENYKAQGSSLEEANVKVGERLKKLQEKHSEELDAKDAKIEQLNDSRSKLYQEREDAQDKLELSKAAVQRFYNISRCYKATVKALQSTLSLNPLVQGSTMTNEEGSGIRHSFESIVPTLDAALSPAALSAALSPQKDVLDSDQQDPCEVLDVAMQTALDTLQVVSRRNKDISQSKEKLTEIQAEDNRKAALLKQMNAKLQAKGQEVQNLMASMKDATAEAQVPSLDGTRIVSRVWVAGTGYALLRYVPNPGEESVSHWFPESAVKKETGYQALLDESSKPIVLEDIDGLEAKLIKAESELKEKDSKNATLQEEFRQYKIRAHSAMRNKTAQKEEEERAKALEMEKEKVQNLESELANAQSQLQGLGIKVKELEFEVDRARTLGTEEGKAEGVKEGKADGFEEGKAAGLKEGRAQGIKEGKAEALAVSKAHGHADGAVENDGKSSSAKRDDLPAEPDSPSTPQPFGSSSKVEELKARVQDLEAENAKNRSQALKMLEQKDDQIKKLRAKLKGTEEGTQTSFSLAKEPEEQLETLPAPGPSVSQAINGDPDNSSSATPRGSLTIEPIPLAAPEPLNLQPPGSDGLRGQADGLGLGTEGLASQEDQIMHIAAIQAQRDEKVLELEEKVAMLKENVAEGKKLQDMLCNERDVLRTQLESVKREQSTMQRVEKLDSKFQQGMNMEYLRNVLVKYIETQDHDGLIPVFYSVLEFSPDEKRRLEAARARLTSVWGALGLRR